MHPPHKIRQDPLPSLFRILLYFQLQNLKVLVTEVQLLEVGQAVQEEGQVVEGYVEEAVAWRFGEFGFY